MMQREERMLTRLFAKHGVEGLRERAGVPGDKT